MEEMFLSSSQKLLLLNSTIFTFKSSSGSTKVKLKPPKNFLLILMCLYTNCLEIKQKSSGLEVKILKKEKSR